MAKTGRPRIPTKLHILHGNPSKLKLNTTEPDPMVIIPRCPRLLKGEARREWRRITKELETLGLVSQLDRAAIAAYCVQWARWIEAEGKIASEAAMVFKTAAGYPIQSPWLAISNKALELMHKYLTEFGLTAASRTRLKVEIKKPDTQPSGAKRFLASS